jgi:hypothetical protein
MRTRYGEAAAAPAYGALQKFQEAFQLAATLADHPSPLAGQAVNDLLVACCECADRHPQVEANLLATIESAHLAHLAPFAPQARSLAALVAAADRLVMRAAQHRHPQNTILLALKIAQMLHAQLPQEDAVHALSVHLGKLVAGDTLTRPANAVALPTQNLKADFLEACATVIGNIRDEALKAQLFAGLFGLCMEKLASPLFAVAEHEIRRLAFGIANEQLEGEPRSAAIARLAGAVAGNLAKLIGEEPLFDEPDPHEYLCWALQQPGLAEADPAIAAHTEQIASTHLQHSWASFLTLGLAVEHKIEQESARALLLAELGKISKSAQGQEPPGAAGIARLVLRLDPSPRECQERGIILPDWLSARLQDARAWLQANHPVKPHLAQATPMAPVVIHLVSEYVGPDLAPGDWREPPSFAGRKVV